MAISNYDRVSKVMDLLKAGLQPFVEREMKAQHNQLWLQEARASVAETQVHLFTGSAELAKSVGLRASRRIVLFNGPIECRLLKYELY